MIYRYFFLLAALVFIQSSPLRADMDTSLELDRLQLAPGYTVSLYARVPGARSLTYAPELNAVIVGTRGPALYAVVDGDEDGTAENTVRLKSALTVANGVAWKAPYLYVAEQPRIVRFRADSLEGLQSAPAEVLFNALPDDPWHGWRYAAFGPDGWLYVSIGSPCNICEPTGFEGTIIRLGPDGDREPEVFAKGIRNSVGVGFHPRTGDLFFTDNGADNMGDDSPPDEFNHAPKPGLHFGFPFFGGGLDRTALFRDTLPPPDAQRPAVRFGAHVAALGFAFHRGDAIVAQHGSWNRSVPDGYRLVRVPFGTDGIPKGTWQPFVEGWLNAKTGEAWGRPVDVLALPDGSLLVSDDRAGAIYRITGPRTP